MVSRDRIETAWLHRWMTDRQHIWNAQMPAYILHHHLYTQLVISLFTQVSLLQRIRQKDVQGVKTVGIVHQRMINDTQRSNFK